MVTLIDRGHTNACSHISLRSNRLIGWKAAEAPCLHASIVDMGPDRTKNSRVRDQNRTVAHKNSTVRRGPFSGGSRWIEIAVVLRDRSRTLAECAQELGVSSGTIYRQLHRMLDADLLVASDPETGPGTRFHLHERHLDALDAALTKRQPAGLLQADQPILLVEVGRLLDVARALMAADIVASVVWAAQLDDDRFILGIDRGASAALRGRVRGALEGADISCRAGRVSDVFAGPDWRAVLAAVRAAAS